VLRIVGSRNHKYESKPVVRLVSATTDIFDTISSTHADFKIEVPLATFNKKSTTWMDAPIPEGKRNTTLTAIAGALRRIGMDEECIYAVLRRFANWGQKHPLSGKRPGQTRYRCNR